MISREQAAELAAATVRRHTLDAGNLEVVKVVAAGEPGVRAPLLYLAGNETLEECWIVYFSRRDSTGLCASTIMLISRDTGAMVYFGSAFDEG